MLKVYHYTTKDSLEQIKSSGYIKESPLSNADAVYGQGVYLTTMSPAYGRKKISNNNWGNIGPTMEEEGKADCAIELCIPESNLKRASSGDRDIWIHQGDIVLSDYEHSFLFAPDGGQS